MMKTCRLCGEQHHRKVFEKKGPLPCQRPSKEVDTDRRDRFEGWLQSLQGLGWSVDYISNLRKPRDKQEPWIGAHQVIRNVDRTRRGSLIVPQIPNEPDMDVTR